ncbi:MAG: branched-chain amino acid transport system ATP-binding protein [Gammaproteobacteria bacterium]
MKLKTALFNTILSVYEPSSNSIFLGGEDITGLQTHQLFPEGLLRTFQIAHEFPILTFIENLMMLLSNKSGGELFNVLFRRGQVREEEKKVYKKLWK